MVSRSPRFKRRRLISEASVGECGKGADWDCRGRPKGVVVADDGSGGMEKAGRRVAVGDRLPRGQIRVYLVAERATRRISGKLFPLRSLSFPLFLSLCFYFSHSFSSVLSPRVLESEEPEETLGALVESSIEI